MKANTKICPNKLFTGKFKWNTVVCVAVFVFGLSGFSIITKQTLSDEGFIAIEEMGEKYLSDSTAEQKKAWRNRMLNSAQKHGLSRFSNRIFKLNDGGPLGSQWNTNANLFCILRFDAEKNARRSYVISLNGAPFGARVKERYASNKVIAYFDLPSKVWEKKLKKTTKEDFKKVFDPATANSKDPNVIAAMQSISFCVVKVQIKDSLKTQEYQGIIRVAYGE